VQKKKLKELSFGEPIIAVRVTAKYCIVILLTRTVSLDYTKDPETGTFNLGSVRGLYHTANNQFGLCCIRGDSLVLPGETPGQVQILTLSSKDKKVFKAHESALRQLAMSRDGMIIATASQQGTIMRIFSTSDPTKSSELRRGLESASIWGLAFSPSAHFLASTSDKGTLHIWDLRVPRTHEEQHAARQQQQQQQPPPPPNPRHKRNSVGRVNHEYDIMSHNSDSYSPLAAPLAAGYLPPPSDLRHAPPANAPSLGTMLSGLAKGTRSATSIEFTIGADPWNWQGQARYTSTTLPNGQMAKLKVDNVAVPGRPDGKPPKGVLAWDPDGGDRRLWVVEGGADARWEVFELGDDAATGIVKIGRTGFRNYLTRQFPEKS
jgi:hypothetical protein